MFKEFLQKIKDFFNRIFNKNKLMLKEAENQSNIEVGPIVEKNTEEKVESIIEEKVAEKTPNIVEKLKEENKKNQTVSEIIEMVEAKPELMENLSDEQLDVIDDYYIKANERVKEEIEAIDQKIASITETIRKMDEQLSATGTEN